MTARYRLEVLDETVANVAGRVAPSVPCEKGCADCCRSLGEIPAISLPEWQRLEEVIAARPDAERLLHRLASWSVPMQDEPLAGASPTPIACPLLDEQSNACTAYDARPLKCRSFGYYIGRDGGRWCQKIEVVADRLDVVWGNYDALEQSAKAELGPNVSIVDWAKAARAGRVTSFPP